MKIVVAIDSLKGSLTSIQAGEAIEKGIKKVDLEAEVVIKPLADGGEGTVDALVDGMGGKLVLGFSGAVTKGATACNEEEKCTGESDRYGRTGISFDKSFNIKNNANSCKNSIKYNSFIH